MKSLRNILSVLLAGALLFSTLGFSVSAHYCMGMLVAESFYHLGNESCGMETQAGCESKGPYLDYDCCDDQNLSLAGIDVISSENSPLNIEFKPASQAIHVTNRSISQWGTSVSYFKSIHAPPQALRHGKYILVHYQRFLI